MALHFRYILLLCLLLPATIQAQDTLTVQGILQDTATSPLKNASLSFTDANGERVYLRAELQEGKFLFQVPAQDNPVLATLRLSGQERTPGRQARLMLFIQQSDIEIRGNIDELELAGVEGGQENQDYNTLRQKLAEVTRKKAAYMQDIMAGRLKTKSPEGKAALEEVTALNRKESRAMQNFIRQHPASFVSLFLLKRNRPYYTSQAYADAFHSLNPAYRQTSMAREIARTVDAESVTARGKQVPDFTRTRLQGDPLKLSDLKGKVVLLDFWGSWCGPCRASMPHLKSLYSKYKEEGFEILGIAQERGKTLQESTASWEKAVEEMDLPWLHVLNNQDVETMDIVRTYNISGFPTKILLDQQGRVILRVIASATDDIDRALKEIFKH